MLDVLIVDDSEFNRIAFQAVLENAGYRLTQAGSGNEAITLAERTPFAVILLDVKMPGLDGYETAARLRRLPFAATSCILFVSASPADERRVFGGHAPGTVRFLYKPVDDETLRASVRELAEQWRAQSPFARHSSDFQEIFEAAAVGLVQAEPLSGRIVRTNPRLCEVLGRDAAEVVGRLFFDLIAPAEREAEQRQYEALMRGELTELAREGALIAKGGRTIRAEIRMTVARSADGTPRHAVVAIWPKS